MVLAAYGLKLSERELRRRTGWREQIGTSSTAVVAVAKSLGFLDSREVFGLRLHDLRDALRAGVYPIVGIGLEPYGHTGQHAQVVVRVTSRRVSVHDPLLGRLTPNLLTFESAMDDHLLMGISLFKGTVPFFVNRTFATRQTTGTMISAKDRPLALSARRGNL